MNQAKPRYQWAPVIAPPPEQGRHRYDDAGQAISSGAGLIVGLGIVVWATLKFGLVGFILGAMAAAVVALIIAATPCLVVLAFAVIGLGGMVAMADQAPRAATGADPTATAAPLLPTGH